MDNLVESGAQAPEPEESGEVLQPANDQLPSQPEGMLDAQLVEHIRQEVDRRFQSAKDKRWAQLEKQYGELNQLMEGKPSSGDRAEPQESQLMERIHKLTARAGLANDPRVAALLQREGISDDLEGYLDLLEDITLLVLEQGNAKPVSAASVIQPGGGQAPLQDLRQDYEVRRRKLRPGDVDSLTALKREFRGKGLQVY
jgi:hypothetical protein